jgi:antitoxin component of RelBE/YafQ-DinJ toxin-antitoxin module
MTKTILNIKTDPQTKQQIQEFAAELGIPVSVIMNAQIKQMLRDRKIILSTELEPTPYLEKIMKEVEEDLINNRNITHTNSKEEALAHLRSL